MELSKKELNKLKAAADIVENGDMAVIQKLIEFIDLIEDMSESRTLEVKDMAEMVDKFEKIKTDCEDYMSNMSERVYSDVKSKCEDSTKEIAESTVKDIRQEITALLSKTESKLSAMENIHKGQMDTLYNRLLNEIKIVKASIPKPQDMSGYEEEIRQIKASIPTVPPPVEVTGEEIVQKINELRTDKDELKIDKSHIKGIAELEAEIRILKSRQGGSNPSIAGRDLFQDIDLSSQLDGVTKTFNLPAVWNIISVNLSSFPFGALRKGVDFTYTPTSITFTSEIDAATQLSAGQSCILTVVNS